MRNWTTRERGLGAGIVLMAVAAIAVPAWAADDEEPSVEPAAEATEEDGLVAPAPRPARPFLALPSREEREAIDACMSEHGFGPDEDGVAITIPAPEPGSDDPPPLTDEQQEFVDAAEDCGLPSPEELRAEIGEAIPLRGDHPCPPLPPPPALRERLPDDQDD